MTELSPFDFDIEPSSDTDLDDEPLTPFPVVEHRYFTPPRGLDFHGLVQELSKVSRLGALRLEKSRAGLILRAGALRAEVKPDASPSRAVVRAMNELLARSEHDDRFIPLEWIGGGEVFVSASMDQSLELLHDDHLAIQDLSELMDIAAW